MAPSIHLSDELFVRAQKLAIPLVDTVETVIGKAFDALEAAMAAGPSGTTAASKAEAGVRPFNPANPPNLAFTQPVSVTLCGQRFVHGHLYWNTVMFAAIREAGDRGLDAEGLLKLMVVPSVNGKKEEHGYKYMADLGISVQGQDANGAWKQTYEVVKELGLPIEVTWRWQNNPKATLPGQMGSFSVA